MSKIVSIFSSSVTKFGILRASLLHQIPYMKIIFCNELILTLLSQSSSFVPVKRNFFLSFLSRLAPPYLTVYLYTQFSICGHSKNKKLSLPGFAAFALVQKVQSSLILTTGSARYRAASLVPIGSKLLKN
jgi:hypothetical protein